jgi:hypothetical protein
VHHPLEIWGSLEHFFQKRDLCISHDVFWSSSDEKFGQEKNTNMSSILFLVRSTCWKLNHVEFNVNMVSIIHV